MIRNIVDEEKYSSQAFPLGFIKRFILFRVPFIILIGYSLALINFASLIYYCFGLLLFIFEVEKHFSKKKGIEKFKGSRLARLTDLFHFQKDKMVIYYLILMVGLVMYIGKFAVLLLYYHGSISIADFPSKVQPQDLELYFLEEETTSNYLLTFLPNLGIIILAGTLILLRSYIEKVRNESVGQFKGIRTSQYIFAACIVVILATFAETNVSILNMLLVTVVIIYFILWGNKVDKQTENLFYPFAKILQTLALIILIMQYLAAINPVRTLIDLHQTGTEIVNFLGIIDLNVFINKADTICYLAGLFLLLIITTFYADIRKSSQLLQIYKDITGTDYNPDSSEFYQSSIDSSHIEDLDRDGNENFTVPARVLPGDSDGNQPVTDNQGENKPKDAGPAKRRPSKSLARGISTFIQKIIRVFKRVGFSLRILQLGSIVVVFRCNTVFSLPIMAWLFATSLTYNVKIIYSITALLGLPSSILSFYAIYYSKIPNNGANIPSWLGNIDLDPYWLDYILTFALIVLYCNFLRLLIGERVRVRDDNTSFMPSTEFDFRKTINVVIALFLKSTYYLALLGLYLIGTNKVSLFNLVLVAFFIIFFISEHHAMKGWVLLLIGVIIIITTRYIWGLGIITVTSNTPVGTSNGLKLVGIVDVDSGAVQGGIDDQSELTNFLFWFMFFFVLLQYDVYRSTIIRKNTIEILRETPLARKHLSTYNGFVHNLIAIYYQGVIWVGYLIISIIIIVTPMNLLNMVQIIFLLGIFIAHVTRLKNNPESAHGKILHVWGFFVLINIAVTSIKYLYSFLTFSFIDEYLLDWRPEYAIVDFIITNSKFIGVRFESHLQGILIGDILILVLSVTMRGIFKTYRVNSGLQRSVLSPQVGVNDVGPRLESPLLQGENATDYEKYISFSLLKEWPRVARGLEILSYFFSLLIFLYVALLSSLFRLSLGFFIMLAIYCYYFCRVNSTAINLINQRKISQKTSIFMHKFREWFTSRDKKEKLLDSKFLDEEDSLIFNDFVEMTLKYRIVVWRFAFVLAVILFVASYVCQMFSNQVFQLYGTTVSNISLYGIHISFFVGVYSQGHSSFFVEDLPYLVLIILSVLELKLVQLLQMKIKERPAYKKTDYKSVFRIKPAKEKSKEESSELEISERKSETNIFDLKERPDEERKEESFEEADKKIEEKAKRAEYQSYYDSFPTSLQMTREQKKTLKRYYENNYIYLKVKAMEGIINVIVKLVIFMLLVNAINKENIFGPYYLIGAFLAWRATTYDIKLIVNITYFAVALSLLQYLLLLFNLNTFTSPEPVPPELTISSLLAWVYGSNIVLQNQFVKLLGLGFQAVDTETLIGDFMTFLIIQMFIWGFMLKADYILNKLAKHLIAKSARNSLASTGQEDRNTNYEIWKSIKYVYLKFIVNFTIIHSSRTAVVLMTIIALLNISLSNFILAILLLLNIVYVDFMLSQARLKMKRKFTAILLQITQIVVLIFLAIFIVNQMPLDVFPVLVNSSVLIDKVFVFLILQLSVDVISTNDYDDLYERNAQKNAVRGRLIALSTTYKFNDIKLYKFLDDYVEKKELNRKLQLVSESIAHWHEQFFDNPRVDHQRPTLEDEGSEKEGRSRRGTRDRREPRLDSWGFKTREKKPSEKEKEAEPSEIDKLSILTRIKIKLIGKMTKWRNPFLFTPTGKLYKGIIEKNKNIVKDEMKKFRDFPYKDFNKIAGVICYIERFYLNLELEIHKSPELGISQNMKELQDRGLVRLYNSPTRDRMDSLARVIIDVQEAEPLGSRIKGPQDMWSFNASMDEQDKLKRKLEYSKYGLFKMAYLALQVWLSYWEYFSYIILVIYQISAQGFIMLIIPFAIFGYALTEETRPRFKFWTISFTYIVLIILLKFADQYFGDTLLSAVSGDLLWLVGPTSAFSFEIIIIIILMIQISLDKVSGFEQGPEIVIENVNHAFLRKKINDDFSEIKKKLEKNKKKYEEAEMTVSRTSQRKKTDVDEVLDEVHEEFLRGLAKFSIKNQNNYFFRLFSYYNKKVGIDVYPALVTVELILVFYILIFYSAMENGQLAESITNSFKYNEFSGPMVVALFIQMAILLFDRRIVLINNNKEKTDLEDLKDIEEEEEEYEDGEEKEERKEKEKEIELEERKEEQKEEEPKPDKIDEKVNQVKEVVDDVIATMTQAPSLSDEAYKKYSSFVKYVLQIILLIAYTYFIYGHLPTLQDSNSAFVGAATIIFGIIYSIYFGLSAFQLKYGIPNFKGRMVLMKNYSMMNGIGFKIYRAIPFFFEIKTFMDWTFTATSLDLFQWLKIEDVYGQLFTTKIQSDGRFSRQLGERIDKFSKITTGCGGITLLLLLILGPLLLFSTYNPFGADNFVVGASASISIQVGNNTFSLFENSYANTVPLTQTNDYDPSEFASQPAIRDVSLDKIQFVTMSAFSQETWSITQPNYLLLQHNLFSVYQELKANPENVANLNATTPVNLQLNIEFIQSQNQQQNIAPATSTTSQSLYQANGDLTPFTSLLSALNCSTRSIATLYVPDFYDSLVRLGAAQPPAGVSIGTDFLEDVSLKLVCPQEVTPSSNPNLTNSYWTITTNGTSNGLIFYTITNNMPSFLVNFSIQAFYVTIVLVVFNLVRGALSGQIQNLTLSDLPAAEELIQICEGILIARADKNLVKEEKLYWELVDILRSPEVLKLITKSAVKERLKKAKKKIKTD